MPDYTAKYARANSERLENNPYPGRGIVLGISRTGHMALQVYWVMGRSENSRNRLLVLDNSDGEKGNVVRTVPYDESKVSDPSLIMYNAMRRVGARNARGVVAYDVVSNGSQTDSVARKLAGGRYGFGDAVGSLSYEPDSPNYTPRITGTFALNIRPAHGEVVSDPLAFGLSVRRREAPSGRVVDLVELAAGKASAPVIGTLRNRVAEGVGLCVHTYLGDGEPLPSFDKRPYPLPVGEDAEETATMYWDMLNADNRVALVVKAIGPNLRDETFAFRNALAGD